MLTSVQLRPQVTNFINNHREDCVIVTSNLTCWCEGLFSKIGCQCYGSEAECNDDRVVKLKTILRKEQIVDQYKALGETVVFIGDGNNDLEAMRHANISIATGLTHSPAQSLMAICDYVIYSSNALVRQLRQLCGEYCEGKSVVICCAGIGSRLGLGQTKALVQINGTSLISWQLKLFKNVEDVRIVIGFQGGEIINEVNNGNVGLILDSYNLYLKERSDCYSFEKINAKQIFAIHLMNGKKVSNTEKITDQRYRTFCTDGDAINLFNFLNALKTINYKGMISTEVFNPKYPKIFTQKQIINRAFEELSSTLINYDKINHYSFF